MATFFQRGILPAKRGPGSCDRGVEILMAKVTNLEEVRAEKTPLCDYCGEPDHKGTFECPRIKTVKFDNDEDTVTITLWHPSLMAGGE
jgi:tRNA(Ile2) C34 agmatinyltransferase TiaS